MMLQHQKVETRMKATAVLILAMVTVAAPVRAQQSLEPTAEPKKPGITLTNADIKKKTPVPPPEVVPTPPPSVAPSTNELLDRARAVAAQLALEEFNRRQADEQQRRLENAAWFVKDVDFGVTEQNRVFMRFGWRVTVKNGIPRPQTYDVEVQFLDSRGLVVDTARRYRQTIAAQDEQTLRGDALISVPAAFGVTQVNAIARRHPEND
jgi:hypothetical protein